MRREVDVAEKKSRKNFGGRPRQREPEAGDKVHLGVRVAADLKDQLDAVARTTGRSLSQETELRLARSFERQGLLMEALELRFGPYLAGLLVTMGGAMANVLRTVGYEPTTNTSWPMDAEARCSIENVAYLVLASLPTPEMPEDETPSSIALEAVVNAIASTRDQLESLAPNNIGKGADSLTLAVMEALGPTLKGMAARSSWEALEQSASNLKLEARQLEALEEALATKPRKRRD